MNYLSEVVAERVRSGSPAGVTCHSGALSVFFRFILSYYQVVFHQLAPRSIFSRSDLKLTETFVFSLKVRTII